MQVFRTMKARTDQEIIDLVNKNMVGHGVQPPYLQDLIPDSYLPDNTGYFTLKGSFFTPDMSIDLEDQTVHEAEFISDNEYKLRITTNPNEGEYGLTLNNGYISHYPRVLLLVLGDVFTPNPEDFINKSGLTSERGSLLVTSAKVQAYADIDPAFITVEPGIDFQFRFRFQLSEYQPEPDGHFTRFGLYDENSNPLIVLNPNIKPFGIRAIHLEGIHSLSYLTHEFDLANSVLSFRRIGNTVEFFRDNQLLKTYTYDLPTAVFKFRLSQMNITDIKYIELATS